MLGDSIMIFMYHNSLQNMLIVWTPTRNLLSQGWKVET